MKHTDIARFIDAQEGNALPGHDVAVREIREGKKRSHWAWYEMPQMRSLGTSGMSWFYGIADLDEAVAYLSVPVLRNRMVDLMTAMCEGDNERRTAEEILGEVDAMKLSSCATLFLAAALKCGDKDVELASRRLFGHSLKFQGHCPVTARKVGLDVKAILA